MMQTLWKVALHEEFAESVCLWISEVYAGYPDDPDPEEDRVLHAYIAALAILAYEA